MSLAHFCRFCRQIYWMSFFFSIFSRMLVYIPISLGRGSIFFTAYGLENLRSFCCCCCCLLFCFFFSLKHRTSMLTSHLKTNKQNNNINKNSISLRLGLSYNITHFVFRCYTHPSITLGELGLGKSPKKILIL